MSASSTLQAALIDALMPRNFLIRRQIAEELEDLDAFHQGPKSLMMCAAESTIVAKLRNQDNRRKVLETSQDFRLLLATLPMLIASPELALARFQKELFSEPVQWVAIAVGRASIDVRWNRYQPLLTSKRLGNGEAVEWALKFMMTAVKKGLISFGIYFNGLTDEEFETTQTAFLATAFQKIDKIMEPTDSTYVPQVHVFSRTLNFLKVRDSEVYLYK